VEKALVNFAFAPEKALPVLNPFEIADGDTTGVAENVRHGENSFCINDCIGLPGGRAVCAFAENARLNILGVLFGDLVFDGGGYGYFAGLKKVVRSRLLWAPAGEVLKRFFLRVDPVNDFGDVEPLFVVEATADVGETNDFVASLLHQLRGERAN